MLRDYFSWAAFEHYPSSHNLDGGCGAIKPRRSRTLISSVGSEENACSGTFPEHQPCATAEDLE